MDISAEDFRHHFELLSDETLVATRREDLVPTAQAVYDEELVRRGLIVEGPEEPVEGVLETDSAEEPEHAAESQESGREELVSVGEFTDIEEARLALGLLQSAEIPSGLANDKMALGLLLLMVPASYLEAAIQVLGGEISEEELAAQAEAAGFTEEE